MLTGDLCDALLDTSGSAAVLAELEREQFFTTSTDAGLTYHYHQVLQTHLEVLLVDELGEPGGPRALLPERAQLLEAAGRPAAAIRAHARAEDWGSVARLLKPDTAPVGDDEALWGMLSLPGAPTDDPGLVLAGARRLSRHGRIAESVAAFRQAEGAAGRPGVPSAVHRGTQRRRGLAAAGGTAADARPVRDRPELDVAAAVTAAPPGHVPGPRPRVLHPAAGPRRVARC